MKKMMEMAEKAYENSYSPYSGIRIGAAVKTGSGKIYTGTNIENASYGATICAERSAVSKAVSDGETKITAVAVTGDMDGYAYPCGICRQVISEFMEADMEIAVSGRGREMKVFKLKDLFPNVFIIDRGGK